MTTTKKKKMGRNRAAVVVLGDFGRSPRMQYHALSLARQAHLEVGVVAYGETMAESPSTITKVIFSIDAFAHAIISVLYAYVVFVRQKLKIPTPDVFIVQNPPSVPTLVAVQWASWFRQAAVVVDWHNFGYTLLGLSLGRSSFFVRIFHWFEKHYGKMADGALCVTRAMQHELAQKWEITTMVLYDHPPEFFHPASLEEKYKLFCRLKKNIISPYGLRDCVSMGTMGTSTSDSYDSLLLFTTQVGTDISLKMNRPAIIVSSTSWTADEDFGMLLDAAVLYDRRVATILNEDNSVRRTNFGITSLLGGNIHTQGCCSSLLVKDRKKKSMKKKIRRLHLKRVAFRTMWLPAEDYSLLLGSADLGVCLHTSSSGLDIPMKMLFKGFPGECNLLKLLREGALETGSSSRWATEWEEHAMPLISEVNCRHWNKYTKAM